MRIVAMAWNHPRSSFFSNEEVFVAEKALNQSESRLVKLVYGFLPYQPRLSDNGLDYATVHEIRALRDPECDETLAQMTSPHGPRSSLKYSTDSPILNVERSEEHTSELQSPMYLVCRLLLEKKKKTRSSHHLQ